MHVKDTKKNKNFKTSSLLMLWLQQAHPMAPEFVCDTCGVTYAEHTN